MSRVEIEIKTPLAYFDANMLAESLLDTHVDLRERAVERLARLLMAVDVASRTQALEDQAAGFYPRAEKTDAAVREFVESVIEYADDRADAEVIDGRPQGNAEMRLLVAATALRGKLRKAGEAGR